MKKSLMTIAAALALVSCSQEDLLTGLDGKGNGAVGVNTFVAQGTRGVAFNNADEFEATTNGFDLFAFESDGNQFMGTATDGTEFAYNAGWDYADKGEIKFWQQVTDGNTVNFYAVSPANTTNLNITNDAQTIDYTVADNSADQKDLMYAKTLDVDPTNETIIKNGVHIDFYHALSQIVFKAKVHEDYTSYINATVAGVEIVNLQNTGTFTFAAAGFGDFTTTYTPWSNTSGQVSYTAEVDAAGVEVNTALNSSEAVDLTTSSTALLLMPQEITGATLTDNKTEPTDGGTYLKVTCKVYYKGTNDAEATQIVGENDETSVIYIPLTTTWQAGWKYIYTLVFSDDIADPVTINEDLYVGPWYEEHSDHKDLPENGENGSEETEEIVEIQGLRYSVTQGGFYIDDIEDFKTMTTLVNDESTYTDPATSAEVQFLAATYMQTATIDFTDEAEFAFDENGATINFTPVGNIGHVGEYFSGTYQGLGHEIKGLKYTQGSSQTLNVALFRGIENAYISNLVVSGEIACQSAPGGIVGKDNGNSFIVDCTSNVNISVVGSARMAGGIIGQSNGTTIEGCINNGNITQATGADWLGGIVGQSQGETEIIACVNNGNITGENNIGGLVGIDEGTTSVYASYNTGTINATAAGDGSSVKPVGGLVGQLRGKIIGCYNIGKIELNGAEYNQDTFTAVGAIAGVEYNESLEAVDAVKACYWGGSCVSDNGLGTEGWAVTDDVKNAMNTALSDASCNYIFVENEDNTLLVPVMNN